MGAAAVTVAPKIFTSDKPRKKKNVKNIQPPELYIKDFNRNDVIVYENAKFELAQGRVMNGRLYPLDMETPFKPVEKINVGNAKPQKLFHIRESDL